MDILIGFLFGIVFGSFINVAVYRIPRDLSVVFPPSRCMSCKTPLRFYHNIPLISWLFLRGKCAFCQTPISLQYPLVELISGIVAAAVFYKYSVSMSAFLIALSFFMLLALSLIDFRYKMVPDSLNLLAICFAVFSAYDVHGILRNLSNALLFAGGFSLLRFALSYYLTSSVYRAGLKTKTPWNKFYDRTPMVEAMGEGDIMVAATMGALLGVKLGLFSVFLSAILALPVMLAVVNKSQEEQRVPFVPFLSLATFITFLFDSQIMHFLLYP